MSSYLSLLMINMSIYNSLANRTFDQLSEYMFNSYSNYLLVQKWGDDFGLCTLMSSNFEY
jgi:hypothetical protein